MKTPYAIKLYKILYQYKKIGNRLFSIEELKMQFGIKDKYPLYKDFRVRVLDMEMDVARCLSFVGRSDIIWLKIDYKMCSRP